MSAYDRLVDKLGADGRKVTERAGQVRAQCPSHDDRNPSLSVRRIEGQALVHCFAGCQPEDVLAALKMTMADLYDDPSGATYRYDDGRIVHRSPIKKFRQSGNTQGAPTLYRLAEVEAAVAAGRPVLVVEGEKDVHAANSIGLTATCSPMGAGKWHKVDPSALYGGKVLIVADQDEPGRQHARDVLVSLNGHADAAVFKPRAGKDLADHVAAGRGIGELLPMEIEDSEVLAPRRVRITWADQIEPVPVVWAWKDADQGRIPAGSLSVGAGREGTGKSTFATWLTAQITKGTLPGSYYGAPRNVFYVAVEDSWKHTLVPRLMAAGADLGKVARFDVVNIYDDEVMLSLPADNEMLEAAIVEHTAALVVIDPLLSAIGEKINTHQSREVRSALDPLARIADRTNCVLLGIAHFNKGTGTDASSLITGSGAFKDVPRTVFGFVRDDSDGNDVRILTQTKNNLAPEGPSLSYVIEQAVVETKHGPAVTSRFVFTGESERSVHDVLRDARSGGDSDDPGERDEAAGWLTAYLDESGGSAKAADIIAAAKGAGIAERTLTRARKKLKVSSDRDGFGKGAVYVWTAHVGHMEAMSAAFMRAGIHGLHVADMENKPLDLDSVDCGHPPSARNTDNGKCGSCIADRVNAERRASTEDDVARATSEGDPTLPHRCHRCGTPIRHRGGLCASCFGEVNRTAKEEIS